MERCTLQTLAQQQSQSSPTLLQPTDRGCGDSACARHLARLDELHLQAAKRVDESAKRIDELERENALLRQQLDEREVVQ
jgi:hypothetical protein